MSPNTLLLVSTCGTSLLSRGGDPDQNNWLKSIANARLLPPEDARRLDEIRLARQSLLRGLDETGRREASAELNGIAATRDQWPSTRVHHLLIHTDTAVGECSAQIVQEELIRAEEPVELLTSPGLRMDDNAAFRDALAQLTRDLDGYIRGWRKSHAQVVFNLTGGFKSINAFLQTLGMLSADQCVMIFEGSKELMQIPRLPVRMVEEDEIRPHLTVFRRLEMNYPVTTRETDRLADLLFTTDGQTAILSFWGDIVWARVRPSLLGEKLLDPLSPRRPSAVRRPGVATAGSSQCRP